MPDSSCSLLPKLHLSSAAPFKAEVLSTGNQLLVTTEKQQQNSFSGLFHLKKRNLLIKNLYVLNYLTFPGKKTRRKLVFPNIKTTALPCNGGHIRTQRAAVPKRRGHVSGSAARCKRAFWPPRPSLAVNERDICKTATFSPSNARLFSRDPQSK